MKHVAGFIVPILLIVVGGYALLSAFGSSGEQVALITGHAIPRGLTFMFGALGLGGGAVIFLSMFTAKKTAA